MIPLVRSVLRGAGGLLALLFGLTTILFFLLRVTGDPASMLIGPEATPEQVESVKRAYGLSRPLIEQYGIYLLNLLQLDFGTSLASGEGALHQVLMHLPATLLLAGIAMALALAVSIPLGVWLGSDPEAPSRRLVGALVFVAQGTPGFVVGLLLIQFIAVQLRWLPSMGFDDARSWILPSVTLASFLGPKLARVVGANVSEALRDDYVRTARANGASRREVLWRHALPNALLGVTALVGTQFAHLVSGSILVETIFAWPGIGWLLLESTRTLDFPVVQAIAVVVGILVFAVNSILEVCFRQLDPRLRERHA